MLAVIGGSGLARLPELSITDRKIVRTPYGLPSSPLLYGRLGSIDIVFLARHGFNHTVAPHEINYRANIRALADADAEQIIAVSSVTAVGGCFEVGALVMPHDLIDYTHSRAATFFEGEEQAVVHTDFTRPYSDNLRRTLAGYAVSQNTEICLEAVYGCIQGPRLPTAAEMRRYRNDGVDVVGMTGMPEAVLARELGLEYVHLCGVTAPDCFSSGRSASCDTDADLAVTKIRALLAGL